MSTNPHDAHGDHHGHGVEIPHASLRDYTIGFILSVILTAIPFGLVMSGALPAQTTAIIIVGFTVVQVLVHMVYFLHMSPKAEGGWTITSLLFTIIVVVIMLAGSLWVMSHLHSNMMPLSHDTAHEMSQTP